MKYSEVSITSKPFNENIADVISAQLGEIGFETFAVEEEKLLAYIPTATLDEDAIDQVIKEFPLEVILTYSIKDIDDKNWNEEWEKITFHLLSLKISV